MIVTFFGHKDAPRDIQNCLEGTLRYLIEKEKADIFYVGNHGNFDQFVRLTLKRLKAQYPHICYTVVLAYMPKRNEKREYEYYGDTILPEEVAVSLPRFAISKRNCWMIEKSDTVVTYVTRSYGGAAKWQAFAKAKGKRILNLEI